MYHHTEASKSNEDVLIFACPVSVVLFNTLSSTDNALYVESVLKLCLLTEGSI